MRSSRFKVIKCMGFFACFKLIGFVTPPRSQIRRAWPFEFEIWAAGKSNKFDFDEFDKMDKFEKGRPQAFQTRDLGGLVNLAN